MKEILYIQAGELSNYSGIHFWNAQESYLQSQDSDIDPAISFCESMNAQSSSTLCPRLIAFDRKSNFGNLGCSNALGMVSEDEIEETPALWSGNFVEYRQERIPKSAFQSSLEDDEKPPDQEDDQAIRYWSDFSRVYFLPRSLQKTPDPPDWETTSADWTLGQELFTRFNEEMELMDGTLRLFVEDCDNIQGVQIMNDTDTFGSFMSSFLASFRDEYLKLPSLSFPVLSGAIPDGDEIKRTRKLVNEALYLGTLSEFSSMNVPIEDPKQWTNSVWGAPLNFPSTSLYHQSAILSTHVETCTLPFRMGQNRYDFASVSGYLNWRGTSPFAELSGLFPLTDFKREVVNFSSGNPIKLPYARWDVTRGLSPKMKREYDTWSSQIQCVQSSVHTSPYPLPNSFPEFNGPNRVEHKKVSESIEAYSSLSSSSNTSKIFKKYASLIDTCIKRRTTSTTSIDIPLDDLKDLANDLWTMHDNSAEDTGDFDM